MKKRYSEQFVKLSIGNEKYKVTVNMLKVIEMCRQRGEDIDDVLMLEIYDMENSMLNDDRNFSDNNKSINRFPNYAFKTQSAENEVIRNLTYGQLDDYLVGCTDLQRDRFLKNKYYGYSIEQIAKSENVCKINVSRSISIAKKKFIENANKQ